MSVCQIVHTCCISRRLIQCDVNNVMCFIFIWTSSTQFPFSLLSSPALCILLKRITWLVAIFGTTSISLAVSERLTRGINPNLVKDLGCYWLSDSSTTKSLPKSYLMPCMQWVSLSYINDCEQYLLEIANEPMKIFCFLLFHAHIQIPYINMSTPKSVPSCRSACKIHTMTCVKVTQPWK